MVQVLMMEQALEFALQRGNGEPDGRLMLLLLDVDVLLCVVLGLRGLPPSELLHLAVPHGSPSNVQHGSMARKEEVGDGVPSA